MVTAVGGTAAALQALDPGEHLVPVIAAIPAKPHMRNVAGTSLLADPADRDAKEFGDRGGVDQALAHLHGTHSRDQR
jgi:hypothetical protein